MNVKLINWLDSDDGLGIVEDQYKLLERLQSLDDLKRMRLSGVVSDCYLDGDEEKHYCNLSIEVTLSEIKPDFFGYLKEQLGYEPKYPENPGFKDDTANVLYQFQGPKTAKPEIKLSITSE